MLTIDFETRSCCDLKRHGSARYADDPTTQALCLAYGPRLWKRDDPPPPITGPVRAHNASFERNIWRTVRWPEIPVNQWQCTAAQAAHANAPRSLDKLSTFLNLGDAAKDKEGHRIMLKLCKPAKKGGFIEDAELFEKLFAYCKQDVVAEETAADKLPKMTDREQRVWQLDRTINERGVPVDVDFCKGAMSIVGQLQERCATELPQITNGEVQTPSQVGKLLDWAQRHGAKISDLRKETISTALEWQTLPPDTRRVLEIREIGAPAAVKKYQSAIDRVSDDGRIREQFLYYGAATGRWSGSGVQFHNLKRQLHDCPQFVIDAILNGDLDVMAAVCDKPMAELQNAVRQMVCAPEGYKLVISDFAAIEARVLHWVAKSPGVQVFRDFDSGKGEEPYKIEAAKIFGCSPASVDKQQRQLGKVAVLGLGYGMGAAKYVATVLAWTGIKIELALAEKIVKRWRRSNPSVTLFWRQLETAFRDVVGGASRRYLPGGVSFGHCGEAITMKLPSGRELFYWGAKATKSGISYVDNRGVTVHIWGGHLAENAVQAIARDLLVDSMLRCEQAGLNTVMHVHDEIVLQVHDDAANDAREFLGRSMCETADWSKGCPVQAVAHISKRLTKD